MIENYGLAFLSVGEEHIKEFNLTIKCLFDLNNHLDIFVITDNIDLIENKNIHIRSINEPFNFNLKRKAIEFAFEHHNIVVFLDTDLVFTKTIDLNYIRGVKEGVYVRWISNEVDYMGKIITIDDILNTKYGEAIGDPNIKFINEFLIVLRIDEPEKRRRFIKHWDDLYQKTIDYQPNNGNDGALEGLIIYSICNKLELKVERPDNEFFNNIFNIGTLNQIRKTKTIKTVI